MKRIVFGLVVLSGIVGVSGLWAQTGARPADPPPGLNLGTADLEVPWARITIRAASPETGIRGRVRGLESAIFFESRMTEEGLRTVIVGPRGETLYEYREFSHRHQTLTAEDGTEIELEMPPRLEILGMAQDVAAEWRTPAYEALAGRPEGRLIRQLGLELVVKAPSPDLVAERRGLELATQALWSHFEQVESGRSRLTADYSVNSIGYLVSTQQEDLVLDINHSRQVRSDLRHNDDAVNGCFGRCGSDCTGGFAGIDLWPSAWTDMTGAPFPAHQEIRCVSGEDVIDTWYATPRTHSVSGWWTPGCQLHDNCMRTVPWFLVPAITCLPFTPAVPLLDSQGEIRTWTYSEYSWAIESFYAGYSGCTCPGVSPDAIIWDCVL